MPYYYAGAGVDPYPGGLDSRVAMYYDRVPKGEVEVRRASAVISVDGHSLGEVDGFVVDADEHITHFVLERGHLWGRGRSRSRSGPLPGSRATRCTSPCPRTTSARFPPCALAEQAERARAASLEHVSWGPPGLGRWASVPDCPVSGSLRRQLPASLPV